METLKTLKAWLARHILICDALVLVPTFCFAAWAGHHWSGTPAVAISQVAPEIETVSQTVIHPKSVKVYEPSAKKKLAKSLPSSVVSDNRIQVVASSRVNPSERAVTVTTTLNTETGDTQTYTAAAPLPWFNFESRGEVSLDFGYKNSADGYLVPKPVARLAVRQDLLQIKAVHFGVAASVFTDGTWFAGAGVSYRW